MGAWSAAPAVRVRCAREAWALEPSFSRPHPPTPCHLKVVACITFGSPLPLFGRRFGAQRFSGLHATART